MLTGFKRGSPAERYWVVLRGSSLNRTNAHVRYHVRNGDPFFERRVTPIEGWNDISTIGRTSLCVSIGSGNYDHSVASGSRWVKACTSPFGKGTIIPLLSMAGAAGTTAALLSALGARPEVVVSLPQAMSTTMTSASP